MIAKPDFRHVTATEARIRFGELMESVHDGEVVVVEKSGREMIALIPVDRLPELRRRAFDETWRKQRSTAFAELKKNAGEGPLPTIRELIDAGRT